MADGLDLRVVGADRMAALGRDLRAAGNSKALRKELFAAMNRTTKPLRAEIKASAVRELPSGLGPWAVKGMSVTAKTRLTGRQVGVRITIRRKNPNNKSGLADINAMNRGRIRHLTWGRGPWHIQQVRPGFVTKVMDSLAAERARRELLKAIDQIAARIRRAA